MNPNILSDEELIKKILTKPLLPTSFGVVAAERLEKSNESLAKLGKVFRSHNKSMEEAIKYLEQGKSQIAKEKIIEMKEVFQRNIGEITKCLLSE